MKRELENLLCDGLLLDFYSADNRNPLKVTEPQNHGKDKLKEFTIVGLPNESLAFSLDYTHSRKLQSEPNKSIFRKFSWLLNDLHNKVHKKSDIILITPLKGRTFILIGELKSKNMNINRAHMQMKNSHLITNFIVELLEEYELGFKLNPVVKYVVFSNLKGVEQYNGKIPAHSSNEEKELVTFINVNNGDEITWKYIQDRI